MLWEGIPQEPILLTDSKKDEIYEKSDDSPTQWIPLMVESAVECKCKVGSFQSQLKWTSISEKIALRGLMLL